MTWPQWTGRPPRSGRPAPGRRACRRRWTSCCRPAFRCGWPGDRSLTFFCNAAYRRDTLGRKYPWALGRPASEVWAEIWDDIGPRIGTVLTTGKATWDEALLLFLERSGYPEETYHTFSYSPLRDDAGAVVGMLCVVSEDTDRVIGERRMATLRDLGSDPRVVRTDQEMLDFAGRQLDRNRQDLPFTVTYLFDDDGATARLAGSTGIAAGHPAAPPALAVGDPDPVWPVATLLRGEPALAGLDGVPFTGLPTGVGSEPPAQALIVPLARHGGAPYGFLVAGLNRYRPLDDGYRGFVDLVAGHLAAGIASARSYRDQQRRAEELAELDRAKTTFFSNISHEFRTPLTLIMGPVQELQRLLAGAGPQVHEELEVISRNGLRLGRLVNTLLDFSRIEAGRMQASYEPADLAQVTAELASVFRSAVDRAGLAFEVDCPPLPEPVYLDRGMWEKVVLNLISNALKFTFDGSIRIAVRAGDGQAVVTVADTGIGVPGQEIPRLFERFHRIENARARSNEGSGIGLALVQELIQLHGGTITASSIEGEGTAFTVRLPFGHAHLPAGTLVPAGHAVTVTATADPFVQEALRWLPGTGQDGDGGTAARPVHEEITPGSGVGPSAQTARALPARVLVADDNADMREYLARLLRTAGYQVTTVADGQAALDAVRAEPPGLGAGRRDDAGPGRPGPGGRLAGRLAHRLGPGGVPVRPGRRGGGGRGSGGRRGRLPAQAVLRDGTAGPGALEPGDGPVPEPRVPVPPRPDRLPPGRLLPHRRPGHAHRGQPGLPGHGRLRPRRPAVPLAAPVGTGPRDRPRGTRAGRPGLRRLPAARRRPVHGACPVPGRAHRLARVQLGQPARPRRPGPAVRRHRARRDIRAAGRAAGGDAGRVRRRAGRRGRDFRHAHHRGPRDRRRATRQPGHHRLVVKQRQPGHHRLAAAASGTGALRRP